MVKTIWEYTQNLDYESRSKFITDFVNKYNYSYAIRSEQESNSFDLPRREVFGSYFLTESIFRQDFIRLKHPHDWVSVDYTPGFGGVVYICYGCNEERRLPEGVCMPDMDRPCLLQLYNQRFHVMREFHDAITRRHASFVRNSRIRHQSRPPSGDMVDALSFAFCQRPQYQQQHESIILPGDWSMGIQHVVETFDAEISRAMSVPLEMLSGSKKVYTGKTDDVHYFKKSAGLYYSLCAMHGYNHFHIYDSYMESRQPGASPLKMSVLSKLSKELLSAPRFIANVKEIGMPYCINCKRTVTIKFIAEFENNLWDVDVDVMVVLLYEVLRDLMVGDISKTEREEHKAIIDDSVTRFFRGCQSPISEYPPCNWHGVPDRENKGDL